jgi:phosphohistidine phosphatase
LRCHDWIIIARNRSPANGSDVAPHQDDDTRRLVLLRHAKSSWQEAEIDDHERPLNRRGKQAGDLLAAYFATRDGPELILCSSARRTRETLDRIRPAFASPPEILIEDGLYLASAASLLMRIAKVPDPVRHPLVIAHNPGTHELADRLAAHSAQKLRARLSGKFPTGAAASYRIVGPWRGIAHASVFLTEFVTPADLSDEVENED